jgi:hypothetical protein
MKWSSRDSWCVSSSSAQVLEICKVQIQTNVDVEQRCLRVSEERVRAVTGQSSNRGERGEWVIFAEGGCLRQVSAEGKGEWRTLFSVTSTLGLNMSRKRWATRQSTTEVNEFWEQAGSLPSTEDRNTGSSPLGDGEDGGGVCVCVCVCVVCVSGRQLT